MGGQKPETNKNKISVGLLAHVDAGKTTLSEALLYLTGAIRKMGRVDDRDAFLDTYELERERGITIFSKYNSFRYTGACGFFCGNGADDPGAGCSHSGGKRGRRRSGAYKNRMETVKTPSCAGISVYQQNGSVRL